MGGPPGGGLDGPPGGFDGGDGGGGFDGDPGGLDGPPGGAGGSPTGDPTGEKKGFITAHKYDFVIQFVWQEKPLSQRLDERRKARLEQEKIDKARAAREEAAKANGGGQ